MLHILGRRHQIALTVIQLFYFAMIAITYTTAGGTSMQFIAETACEWRGIQVGSCFNSVVLLTIIFSALQIVLNLLPNLESVWWISAMGAFCSYLYSTIALILSAWQLATHGMASDTTLIGVEGGTPTQRAFGMFQALGNLAFAWSCTPLITSIQSTLKEPPKAVVSMGKTVTASFGTTAFFYTTVATTGYAALGSSVPGDVLTGFSLSSELELLANIAVLLHMVAAVQIYTQSLFEAAEAALEAKAPHLFARVLGGDANKATKLVGRLAYRSVITVGVTAIAASVPHFSLFGGLVGALTFWPLSVFYPIMMHKTVFPPSEKRKVLLVGINVLMLAVCILATIGSIYAFTQI